MPSARPDLPAASRFGLCSFSCIHRWNALRASQPGAGFHDTAGFYDYARSLGAGGIQSGLRPLGTDHARALRTRLEATGGTFEAEIRLPRTEDETAAFEHELRLARDAGASVVRTYLHAGRRYESFADAGDFHAYRLDCAQRLRWAEPILRRHRMRLGVENHKDFTVAEQLDLLRPLDPEWVGIAVDLGNNLALLEDPATVVAALAPHAVTVHLKDMAVAPHPDGFLLAEVPLGTGCLDLHHLIDLVRRARPEVVFHLEMATRDPLLVPCLRPSYWTTFPARDDAALERTLAFVRTHPPRAPLPSIAGLAPAAVLAAEEAHNRTCLAWMQRTFRAAD